MKCEMYNSEIDIWFDMPDLNTGRHYHSSCGFLDKFIYVFCGISNQTRKYINTIERYDHNNRSRWTLIEMSIKDFPERQGCGVCQRDQKDIVIFGGFAGEFRNDSYLFDTQTNSITRTVDTPTKFFTYQIPVIYDSDTNSIFTVDMQFKVVFKFDTRSVWKTHMAIQPSV
jgi:Kelch motif